MKIVLQKYFLKVERWGKKVCGIFEISISQKSYTPSHSHIHSFIAYRAQRSWAREKIAVSIWMLVCACVTCVTVKCDERGNVFMNVTDPKVVKYVSESASIVLSTSCDKIIKYKLSSRRKMYDTLHKRTGTPHSKYAKLQDHNAQNRKIYIFFHIFRTFALSLTHTYTRTHSLALAHFSFFFLLMLSAVRYSAFSFFRLSPPFHPFGHAACDSGGMEQCLNAWMGSFAIYISQSRCTRACGIHSVLEWVSTYCVSVIFMSIDPPQIDVV